MTTKKDIKKSTPIKATDIQEDAKQAPSASAETVKVLSTQDTSIAGLVKEQPDSVDIESMKDLGQFNLLDLPEECKPLHKVKYRFRWITKGPHTEARLRSSVWNLCTRTNAPFIKPGRFKDHGAIEQGGMLLAFCTESVGEAREQAPAQRSADLVRHYTKELPNDEARGYYKPQNAGGDDEEGIEEGTDF